MDPNFTHITLVVDRSGSMEAIREEAQGGVNSFIRQQAEEPGRAELSLVQFDTEYELVYDSVPVGKVPKYVLQPRGMTALLDAMGRAMNATGQRLAAMPEHERPGLVVFVVMTDGMENASREFNREQIRQMTEHQRTKYNWRFIFLGANQDAFAEAESLGMPQTSAGNYSPDKIFAAYTSASKRLARMRNLSSSDEDVSLGDMFTDAEVKDME